MQIITCTIHMIILTLDPLNITESKHERAYLHGSPIYLFDDKYALCEVNSTFFCIRKKICLGMFALKCRICSVLLNHFIFIPHHYVNFNSIHFSHFNYYTIRAKLISFFDRFSQKTLILEAFVIFCKCYKLNYIISTRKIST